jgi:hypothetical protein
VYNTTKDIIEAALFDASEKQDANSDYYSSALRYLNQTYFDILNSAGVFFDGINPLKHDWPFLVKDGSLILEPRINAGTVIVTSGSPTITFSSPPSISVQGWNFKVYGNDEAFVIVSHTAGDSTATLDSDYVGGPTNPSASYLLFKTDYDLPSDFKKFVGPLWADNLIVPNSGIKGIELEEFNLRNRLNSVTLEVPTEFAFLQSKKIRFNCAGSLSGVKRRIKFRYVFSPPLLQNTTGEEPVVPVEYRSILANGTTYFILLSKNDDRAIIYHKMAQTKLMNMIDDYRSTVYNSADFLITGKRASGRVVSSSGVIF